MIGGSAALAELSEVLGVEVLAVTRDAPAHERRERVHAGDELSLPRDERGDVAKEWWHVRVPSQGWPCDRCGRAHGAGGTRELRLLSQDVRDPRRLAEVIAVVAGVPAVRDRRSARRVLRLMHEATVREGHDERGAA